MTLEIPASELGKLLDLHTSGEKNVKKRKHSDRDHELKIKKRKSLGKNKIAITGQLHGMAKSSNKTAETASNIDVEDPSVAEEIKRRLVLRNECTVRVSGLPINCDPTTVSNLAPEAQACRIPWNPHKHGCEGVAFFEFSSKKLANLHQQKLNNMQFLNKTISACTGKFVSEDVANYDCRKLVVHGLHWKTRVAEIARRFPSSTKIDIRPLNQRFERRKPERAFISFPSAEAALVAYDSRQGCVIRKRKLSVFWARLRHSKTDESTNQKRFILVSGVRSSATEGDVQAVFPQATTIKINRTSGEAWLEYDLEEDCVLDHNNARGVLLKGRKLKAVLHTSSKFSSNTFPKSGQSVTASQVGSHQTMKSPARKIKKSKKTSTEKHRPPPSTKNGRGPSNKLKNVRKKSIDISKLNIS